MIYCFIVLGAAPVRQMCKISSPQGWHRVTRRVEAWPRTERLARRETTLCARIEILVLETADSDCQRLFGSLHCNSRFVSTPLMQNETTDILHIITLK